MTSQGKNEFFVFVFLGTDEMILIRQKVEIFLVDKFSALDDHQSDFFLKREFFLCLVLICFYLENPVVITLDGPDQPTKVSALKCRTNPALGEKTIYRCNVRSLPQVIS